MTDCKIHPYLVTALEHSRDMILASHTEEALRFEILDERIQEREFDEEQRLKRERIVDRRLFRGEAHHRYTVLARGLEESGMQLAAVHGEVRRRLDQDMRGIANEQLVAADLAGVIRNYDAVIPAGEWPAVLCMADSVSRASALKIELKSLGITLVDVALEKFGILKLSCPPEMAILRGIAALPSVHALAAPATPVARPKPEQVEAQVVDARRMMGVTTDIAERYGQDVTLAVLDTGLDMRHPAFARILPGDYRDFTGTGEEDTEGHGTHVCSVAAGEDSSSGGMFSGIAPRCRLVVGKVIADVGGFLENILNGMAWAVFEKRADVLSLSLGDGDTPPNGRSIWSRACDEAFRQGTVVCAAAGNAELAIPDTVVVPADSVSALAVGAVDKEGQLAPFSAKGSEKPESPLYGKPECVAPGVGIVGARSGSSALPKVDSEGKYTQLSGTSMAAPAIAGCLVLLKSACRAQGWEISPTELKRLFFEACRPLKDPDGEDYRSDFEIGNGLVDMQRALDLVRRRPAGTPIVTEIRTPISPQAPNKVPIATGFEPNVCYADGKRYLTAVGVFSPVWKCETCGAPICAVCWQIGERRCQSHRSAATAVAASGSAPVVSPLPRKGAVHMAPHLDTQGCDEFLNGFDFKVRQRNRYFDPLHRKDLRLAAAAISQSFNCAIGRVRQVTLKAGWFKKRPRMALAAVALEQGGIQSGPSGLAPIPDLLQRATGQQGLDCNPAVFYAIGLYSPVEWPPEWGQGQARGNAAFYFVQKHKKGGWIVAGPDDNCRKVFDPERREQKAKRASLALASHPDLLEFGQTPMDSLLSDFNLDRESVEDAVRDSAGRYRIIDYKGRSAVQRTLK